MKGLKLPWKIRMQEVGGNIKDGIRMLGKIVLPVAWVLSNLFPIPIFPCQKQKQQGVVKKRPEMFAAS